MSVTESKIREAALKNAELLRVLSDTDHAIPGLEQQNRFIAELEAEAEKSNKRIKALDVKRGKELKDHEKYRDSVMKRFAYKATGRKEKFEARAHKEETEYFEVLRQEHLEKQMNKNLVEQLEAAYSVRQELENSAQLHKNMQQELDNLYNSIFSGPTPGFPDEDEQEKRATVALQSAQECRSRAESESHAIKLLRMAQQHMRNSLGGINEALSHSRMDMFGGGSINDMMERNALHRAELEAQEARMMVMQAQRMSPYVTDLPSVDINHGNVFSDVFFDNIFTDMAFHDEIKRSGASVQRVAAQVDELLQAAESRHKDLELELHKKDATLQQARASLQKARELAFERVAGAA